MCGKLLWISLESRFDERHLLLVQERGIRQRGLVLHPRGEAFHFCPTPLFAARARFPLKNMVHVHLG